MVTVEKNVIQNMISKYRRTLVLNTARNNHGPDRNCSRKGWITTEMKTEVTKIAAYQMQSIARRKNEPRNLVHA